MQVSVLPFSELDADHFSAWERIRGHDRTFDSPFFCPAFTAAVASVRKDIRVGVLEQNGSIVGLFPFQRGPWGDALPPGGDISQFHGVIVEPDVPWNVDQLLKACNVSSWAFHHLPTSQTQFRSHYQCVGESPFIDLTNGFEAYCAEKKRSGRAIEQAARKARKLEREVGPLRFELHDTSDDGFQRLLAWKSAQHLRTKVFDAFQLDWLVTLLDRIRQTQTESFAGLMSVLYVGDQPVAVHLGIRGKTVAHIWYPAYDVAYGKYSPGITLLLRLTKALARTGVQRIDFAARQHVYKTRFMSGAIPVARGVADRSRWKASLRRGAASIRERIRETPLATPVRAPVQLLRHVGTWWDDR